MKRNAEFFSETQLCSLLFSYFKIQKSIFLENKICLNSCKAKICLNQDFHFQIVHICKTVTQIGVLFNNFCYFLYILTISFIWIK